MVIVGGGIVGCSVAYHLAKLGCRDVVLIEQNTLTSGTTWHAAGAVGSLRASVALTRLTAVAAGLFDELEEETGQATGYKRTGALSIAQTAERFTELKRIPAIGALTGLEAEIVTPSEIRGYSPILEVGDLAGGVWIPSDGQTNPTDTTLALAKGARQNGALLFEQLKMLAVERQGTRVVAVQTDQGRVGCETLVLCTGMWSRHLGRSLGVALPLQAVEHMYVVTEPLEGVGPDQPFVRDFDSHIYIKGDAGKLLVGSIDPVSKPWSVNGVPEDCGFTLLPEDWDHFEPFIEAALKRVPALESVGIRQFLNGPESFTVDGRHIMGPAPGFANLFVAAGFNTTGIMSSAGVGQLLAQWVVDHEPPMDLWDMDPRRFESWAATERFIRQRMLEAPGLAFAMHWPYRQHQTGRNIKVSALHDRLRSQGACFGVVAGWERPLWFAPDETEPSIHHSFGEQRWWAHAAAEAAATRDTVALYDQSQMAVFELRGPDTENVLQRLCANNVAVDTGRVVYTQMLNAGGGIEADVTVTRLGEQRFVITTGAPLRIHDYDWISSSLATSERVTLVDQSSAYAVLALMGSSARALLASLTTDDLSAEVFPFATARELELGYAKVLAQRVSYVGELGFELYVPTEFALSVYDAIAEAGGDFGLRHAGLMCLDSCRLEKGFKHWGHDLSAKLTPLEAGLGFAVAFDKAFTGRDALLRQKEHGLKRRLVLFSVPDGAPLLLHDEPVYRDGVLVGAATSGNRSFRVGGSMCLALLDNVPASYRDYLLEGSYTVQVGDERFAATPHLRAPYDPDGTRMRG